MSRLSSKFKPVLRALACASLISLSSAAVGASINGTVNDNSGAPISDAVLYAAPMGAAAGPRAARTVNVEQINREFVPHVTAVQTGTLVGFPNRDNIRHHVYSFSPAKPFELKLYAGASAPQVLFDKPGAVVLGCNIHDHMLAYVYVVDTPHFAKSANGAARLDNMPAGEYEVRVWHPRLRGTVTPQRIKLGGDSTVALSFSLDLTPPGKVPVR